MGSIEKWACKELEKLGISDPGVIVRYLQPIENPAEVEEYLVSMLNMDESTHTKFIEEFLRKQQEAKNSVDSRFYRKPDLEESVAVKTAEKKKQKNLSKEGNGVNGSSTKNQREPLSPVTSTPPSGKKKSKFVNLYSEDGVTRDVVMLSGRHKCNCQASKHRLVSNCLKCGRIVCEQEGSGPCQFCGNLVVSREEQELLSRGSRKSEALQKRLMSDKNAVVNEPPIEQSQSEALQKAVDHKNRLLEFDRTSEKRTKVYDDESDYFNTSSRWLSQGDRERLQQREEELRRKRFERSGQTVTIDLIGRQVVADVQEQGVYDPEDPLVREILEGKTSDIFSAPDREESSQRVEVSRPQYRDTGLAHVTERRSGMFKGVGQMLKVQDRELQEMRDEGMCLSMHQPWASLLVAGIKLHEGRTWYSPHRGRLWIAAASRVPDQEEIRQLEDRYRVLLNNEHLAFPQHYPAGCLLGCVDVAEVLPQEEYRAKFPDGDSESPYVFVCENPQEMILKFPIKGQHKIYKLDPKIHQTAKKAIRPREE